MTFPIPVVRVFLEDLEGKILFLKRANSKYANEKYCLPGGKVEYNQSVEDACIAEIKQETNLEIYNLEFLFYNEWLPSEHDKYGVHIIELYFKSAYTGELILNDESSDYIWLKPDEINNYDIVLLHKDSLEMYIQENFI